METNTATASEPLPTSTRQIVYVPVDQVIVGERLRLRSQDSIDRMAESFERVGGMMYPIALTPDLALIHGATRLAAAKQLGWHRIESCIYESAADPEVRLLMEWDENEARANLSLEEQLHRKRTVIEPLLKQRAKARQQARGQMMNAQKWGNPIIGGNFPPMIGGLDPLPNSSNSVVQGNFPQAVSEQPAVDTSWLPPVPEETGKVRDQTSQYLPSSGKTIEKYEQLARWSEDDSLPEEFRQEATTARIRANTTNRVNGEYVRIKQMKKSLEAGVTAEQSERWENEKRLNRAFLALDDSLEKFSAAEYGAQVCAGSWQYFNSVYGRFHEWMDIAKQTRSLSKEHHV